jgi:hypothetical protein
LRNAPQHATIFVLDFDIDGIRGGIDDAMSLPRLRGRPAGLSSVNHLRGFTLTDARAGWQPALTGMMDVAYFAGFWLRHQRIGTRFV